MKITLTGSLGNIGKPLATQLIGAGHTVTIISHDAEKSAVITGMGGIPAIGELQDVAFLAKVFKDADVVYTMIPPNFSVADYIAYSRAIGMAYAQAGALRIVNLSSMGAHLTAGTGLTMGAHEVEKVLNKIPGVSIKHVRVPYIYTNLYGTISMIRQQGIMGANYDAHTRLIMAHPADIADGVAAAIQAPFTPGVAVSYVVSDDRTTAEVAAAIGSAIGQPDLRWVAFTDEQALQGMLQNGIPPAIAHLLVEVGEAVRKGIMWVPYGERTGKRTLETFAKEFGFHYFK